MRENSCTTKLFWTRQPKQRLEYYKENICHFKINGLLMASWFSLAFVRTPISSVGLTKSPVDFHLKESNSGYHHHHLLSQH